MRRIATALLAASLLFAACSGSGQSATTSTAPTTAATTTTVDATVDATTTAPSTSGTTLDDGQPTTTAVGVVDPLADRPFEVFVPSSYDDSVETPLVILLHGYGATGGFQESFVKFQPLAEERRFLYVHPDGTTNALNQQFWDATEACCGFVFEADDVGYLTALIDDVESRYNVDPRRIYFVGHSNGGFMSYRMACELSERVAAVATLAGATFVDPADCAVTDEVSVLQIHGTADTTIKFDGGSNFGNEYPSAPVTAATWAGYNGCSPATTTTANALDLVVDLASNGNPNESSRTVYTECPPGIGVELWTINDGQHIPSITDEFRTAVLDFLFAHPKP